ncbi:MAG: DUF2254 domain-containing protein [Gemmatimonadaceae bacterium]
MNKLRRWWDQVQLSLWFVPTLIVAAAVGLAFALIEADTVVNGERLSELSPMLFGAGAEGSRGLLGAIASSMITVAGVTFSITVVALALASSQYSPRILRNFMQDRANQAVLGVFVGIFAYSIVVLRVVRGGDEGAFVPALAVFGAMVLAIVAIGFLIFFIHHIAMSIQASTIIGSAASETLTAVDRLFPAELGEPAQDPLEEPGIAELWWTPVPSRASGYIQRIDLDAFLDVARTRDIVVRMERAIGEFVVEGSALASVSTAAVDEALVREANEAFTIDASRTVNQDAEYGVQQIVDIALKALSPGINDTTTAVNCIDYLGVILARLAGRRIETPYRSDGAKLRVITRGATFPAILTVACGQIRRNADGNVNVLVRLLDMLETVASRTDHEGRRSAILEEADLIAGVAERSVPELADRERIVLARRRIPGLPHGT